jgi:hypothetical protein
MTAEQNAIAHELHQRASRLPAGLQIFVKAGDIITLLNALWDAEKCACVAEERLRTALTSSAEDRAELILIPNTGQPAE